MASPGDRMFKDPSMRIFLVHFLAYVVVTAICAALNLRLSPGTLWFPWVLIGWAWWSRAMPFRCSCARQDAASASLSTGKRAPSLCISSPMWQWCSFFGS